MPYSTLSELPESVKDSLPEHAHEIYMKAFNSAFDQYEEEERAIKTAWSAVKNVYKKNDEGKWIKK